MFCLHPATHHIGPNSSIFLEPEVYSSNCPRVKNHLVCSCPLLEPLQRLWVGNARIGLDVETRKNLLNCHLDPTIKSQH